MSAETARLTGGCQCGAIRYAIAGPLGKASICHCRMCQKAFGSLFGPFLGVARGDFQLTRGTLAIFKSSDVAERGFCRDCGTPLSIADFGGEQIEVSIGSLDHPELVKPTEQIGVESRLPWFGELAGLPERSTDTPERLQQIASSNRQHPDHDTDTWPHLRGSTGA